MARYLGLAICGSSGAPTPADLPFEIRLHERVCRSGGPGFAMVQAEDARGVPVPAVPDRAPGTSIAGDIRLDNRMGLIESLGGIRGGSAACDDSALVLAAFQRWGPDCAEHLDGEFAFAIWDAAARRLFCCTDPLGLRPFFHYFDGRRFLFASAPQLILAVDGIAGRPNLAKFAELGNPAAGGWFTQQSWYRGIDVLPGGTTLTVDSGSVRTRRYWEPRSGSPLRFRDDGEFREALKPLLFDAVRARLPDRGPAVAMLSGGLDSSAIVVVAALAMARENRSLDLLSVMLPNAQDPIYSDERDYIGLFRALPNIRIHPVHAKKEGPFSHFSELDWTFGPHRTSRHYLYADMARHCEALGASSILDGGGGELGLTGYGRGIHAEWFLSLRWGRLFREMTAARGLGGGTMAQQIRRQIIRPFLPPWLLDRRGGTRIGQTGYGLLAPGFTAAIDHRDNVFVAQPGDGPFHRANQADLIRYRQARVMPALFGAAPLQARWPLLDRRLLQFCLDAPAEFKLRGGYSRGLVRIGLEGMLPPAIQWRTTKKPFSPDYLRRYRSQQDFAIDYLAAISANDPVREIIHVDDALGLARQEVAEDERDPLRVEAAMHRVPMAISAIAFLRQFSEFRT